MVTDGSARGIDWAQCGWRGATRRLPSVFATRLLLLLAGCFLAWCGLALLTSTPASAGEVDGGATHDSSPGLLGSDLLGQATGTVATLTDSVASGQVGQPTSTTDRATHADGKPAGTATADGDAELLGNLTSSAVHSTHESLAPVRAVVDPAGALVGTSLERSVAVEPVLLTAHRAGQSVLGEVAGELGPITHSVPLSASVPVTLGAVSSNLGMVNTTDRSLGFTGGAYQQGQGAAAAHSVADAAQAAAQAAGETSPAAGAGGLPVQQDGNDSKPAGSLPGPASSTTSSSTQLGNGSGSAGSYAFAELVRMLAASRPSAVVPTTDADISSGDDERPSVSPD